MKGGERSGAGRKPALANQLQAAAVLIAELQKQVKAAMTALGEKSEQLIREELDNAFDTANKPEERRRSRQYLLNLLFSAVPVIEQEDSPLQRLAEKWSNPTLIKVEGDYVAGQSQGHIIDVEGGVVEGTE